MKPLKMITRKMLRVFKAHTEINNKNLMKANRILKIETKFQL